MTSALALTQRPRRTAVRVHLEVAVRHRGMVIGIGGCGQLRPTAATTRRSFSRSVPLLPGGARDVGGHNICGVPVHAGTCPVRAAHTLPPVAQRFSGNAADWRWIHAASQPGIANPIRPGRPSPGPVKGGADEDPSSQDHYASAPGGQAADHLVDSDDRACRDDAGKADPVRPNPTSSVTCRDTGRCRAAEADTGPAGK